MKKPPRKPPQEPQPGSDHLDSVTEADQLVIDRAAIDRLATLIDLAHQRFPQRQLRQAMDTLKAITDKV